MSWTLVWVWKTSKPRLRLQARGQSISASILVRQFYLWRRDVLTALPRITQNIQANICCGVGGRQLFVLETELLWKARYIVSCQSNLCLANDCARGTPDAIGDYLSIQESFARETLKRFCHALIATLGEEYLSEPMYAMCTSFYAMVPLWSRVGQTKWRGLGDATEKGGNRPSPFSCVSVFLRRHLCRTKVSEACEEANQKGKYPKYASRFYASEIKF